jgi:phospholipase C
MAISRYESALGAVILAALTPLITATARNWGTGRIGDFSFDERAGSLRGLFDFSGKGRTPKLFLDPMTGQVVYRDR